VPVISFIVFVRQDLMAGAFEGTESWYYKQPCIFGGSISVSIFPSAVRNRREFWVYLSGV